MPARQFREDATKVDVLSIAALEELRDVYRVSYECLIHRMSDLQDWTHKKGILAYLQEDDGTCQVKAIAKAASVRGLFGNVRTGTGYAQLFDRDCYERIKGDTSKSGSFESEQRYG